MRPTGATILQEISRSMLFHSAMFGGFDKGMRFLSEQNLAGILSLGFAVSSVAAVAELPILNVQLHMITRPKEKRKFFSTAQSLYNEKGLVRGFFRGSIT